MSVYVRVFQRSSQLWVTGRSKIKAFPLFTAQLCLIILFILSLVGCINQCMMSEGSHNKGDHDEVKAAKEAQEKYQKEGKPAETVFTKIINREIPANIIYEDDKCMAFLDLNPQAPIHFLVIPIKPIPGVSHAEQEDTNVLGHLLYIAKKLAAEKGAKNGFRIVINNGPDALQAVFHLHVHVLGGRQMDWPPG
ncbi:uncharacterized HIT-like protein slr1234 isoform X3 [Lineus longissimus]|uniref:uncharacterized HIT-like protein slr1234 isoform X3 n=1 Tax=Lineus longissimus TaxID=88925 RepID=UPI00315D684D